MKFLSKKSSLQVRLVILKAGRVSGPSIAEEAGEIESENFIAAKPNLYLYKL